MVHLVVTIPYLKSSLITDTAYPRERGLSNTVKIRSVLPWTRCLLNYEKNRPPFSGAVTWMLIYSVTGNKMSLYRSSASIRSRSTTWTLEHPQKSANTVNRHKAFVLT